MPSETVDIATERAGTQLVEPHRWVEKYADYLFSYALSRLNDEEAARDLVQDTFLSALEKVDQFRGESTERTWLTAIIRYKIIDIYRKRASGPKKEPLSGEEEEDFFDPDLHNWKREHWPQPFGVETQDPLHNREFIGILQRCMGKLPALWLSVFTLKHLEEERTETICSELHISLSNYWVIMHRTKVKLRSCLQKNWLS